MKTAPSLLVKLMCKYRYILIHLVAMFVVSAAQSEDIQIKDWMLKIGVKLLSNFLIVNLVTVILLCF